MPGGVRAVRLLINGIPLLGEESGIGNYTRHIASRVLLGRPAWETTFYYGYLSKKLRDLPLPGSRTWLGNLKVLVKKGKLPRRMAKKALELGNRACRLVNPKTWDCYFEPNFVTLPSLAARATVITVHDFSCFRFPQWHPVERVEHMQKNFWRSLENATHLITVSHAIRAEAIDLYGIRPDKITVIPNGVEHATYYPRAGAETAQLSRRYNLPARFILYVGALEPRKNLANLVLAHARLPAALRASYPLLLIGSQGWRNEKLMRLISAQGEHARLLGYVPTSDLPAFYSAAAFFAYPSWYEGFGLPVLEAMACGCPVLTSNAPALKELCNGAGSCCAPDDVDGMAERMRLLLENDDLRGQLRSSALARAKNYNWETAAAAHIQLFERLASAC